VTLGSLFDGISGFPLAASWCGIETKWISEIDEFCLKVSKKNFPNARQYKDVREVRFPEPVDIVCGGFPCQTFSLAGLGEMDLSLWHEMHRIIREVKPKAVVAENVFGLVARKKGLVLEEVCSDLEDEGFTVFPPLIIPACAKNAPHRRDRVWITAYNNKLNGNILGNSSTYTNGFGCQNENRNSIRDNGTKEEKRLWNGINGSDTPSFWDDWPTQSPIYRGDDGISNRLDRIKTLGNAIVPQVAYEIFKAIQQLNLL
jgi:DNA (cytosine-5)-methyltransferase 1